MDTTSTRNTAPASLLSTQWAAYSSNHRSRKNLLLHVATAPFFMAGTVAVAASPWLGVGSALAGAATMALVMAVQGKGHSGEEQAPMPFTSPMNFVLRILAEQWITFPRFVLTGGLARALRDAK